MNSVLDGGMPFAAKLVPERSKSPVKMPKKGRPVERIRCATQTACQLCAAGANYKRLFRAIYAIAQRRSPRGNGRAHCVYRAIDEAARDCRGGAAGLLGLVIYLPSLHGGYLFDDDQYLTNNPLIKTSSGIFRCWYTTHQLDYVPLTISTLWLEWRLWA